MSHVIKWYDSDIEKWRIASDKNFEETIKVDSRSGLEYKAYYGIVPQDHEVASSTKGQWWDSSINKWREIAETTGSVDLGTNRPSYTTKYGYYGPLPITSSEPAVDNLISQWKASSLAISSASTEVWENEIEGGPSLKVNGSYTLRRVVEVDSSWNNNIVVKRYVGEAYPEVTSGPLTTDVVDGVTIFIYSKTGILNTYDTACNLYEDVTLTSTRTLYWRYNSSSDYKLTSYTTNDSPTWEGIYKTQVPDVGSTSPEVPVVVALTLDGNTGEGHVYYNGEDKLTMVGKWSKRALGSATFLGYYDFTNYTNTNGSVVEIRVYNKALSSEEVSEITNVIIDSYAPVYDDKALSSTILASTSSFTGSSVKLLPNNSITASYIGTTGSAGTVVSTTISTSTEKNTGSETKSLSGNITTTLTIVTE